MAIPDNYATAKSNLRDNVKTLVTTFGGISGALLVGTPFSGYGTLELFSLPWYAASTFLLSATILVGVSVLVLMHTLRPDLVYPAALRSDFDESQRRGIEHTELSALSKELKHNKSALIPAAFDSYEKLEEARDKAFGVWRATASFPTEAKQSARQLYEDLNDSLTRVNNWAAFFRLHYRVRRGMNLVFSLGFGALLCIAGFAVATSTVASKSKSESVIIVGNGALAVREPIRVVPIQFAPQEMGPSPAAIAGTERIASNLRTDGATSVLLIIDGSDRGLDSDRAQQIARMIATDGGIDRSRIFVAEGDAASARGPLDDGTSIRAIFFKVR